MEHANILLGVFLPSGLLTRMVSTYRSVSAYSPIVLVRGEKEE